MLNETELHIKRAMKMAKREARRGNPPLRSVSPSGDSISIRPAVAPPIVTEQKPGKGFFASMTGALKRVWNRKV